MKVFKLKTRWFEFEFTSIAGAYWTIGILLITAGAGCLTENVWISLLKFSSEIILKKEESYVTEWIGGALFLIGATLIVLAILERRNQVYHTAYQLISDEFNALGTAVNLVYYTPGKTAEQRKGHAEAQARYQHAVTQTHNLRLSLDEDIYKDLIDFHHRIGEEIIALDVAIRKIEKLNNDLDLMLTSNFDLDLWMKETGTAMKSLQVPYKALIAEFREKMKYSISGNPRMNNTNSVAT